MANEKEVKRTLNRSTAYPGISLQEAVEATKQLRNNLGAGPYSRDSAAVALGYAGVSGSSGTKVAACVHFGLLVRESNAYKQSALADQVFRFISEEEKLDALKAAVQKPTLYAKLINEFNGKALPKMLANILVRNYGITERVAKEAAAGFVKSVEYAGILNNGVISVEAAANTSDANEPLLTEASNTASALAAQSNSLPTGTSRPSSGVAEAGYLPVTIPSTEVKILFPLDYAYDLSVGNFKEGIEKLAENIAKVRRVTDDDESSVAA